MTDLTSFFKKPIICKREGLYLGEVRDVYFDEKCKNIAYFATVPVCGSAIDLNYALPFSEIDCIGDAIAVSGTDSAVSIGELDDTVLAHSMIGKAIYAQNGDFKGRITEIKLSDKGKVISILSNQTAYSPQMFAKFAEIALLKDGESKKRAYKRRLPRPEKDINVSLLEKQNNSSETATDNPSANVPSKTAIYNDSANQNKQAGDEAAADMPASTPVAIDGNIKYNKVLIAESPAIYNAHSPVAANKTSAVAYTCDDNIENGGAAQEASGEAKTPEKIHETASEDNAVFLQETLISMGGDGHTPPRIICEYDFLLGRKLAFPLYTYGGELIAEADCEITEQLVDSARKAGKLVELTLNSKQL